MPQEKLKNLGFGLFIAWWTLLQWSYSSAWPRPADDWKNACLYLGTGLFSLFYFFIEVNFRLPSLKKKESALLVAYILIAALSLLTCHSWYDGIVELQRIILWIMLGWIIASLEAKQKACLAITTYTSATIIALLTLLEQNGYSFWEQLPVSLTSMNPIGHVSYYGTFMAAHGPIFFYLLSRAKKKITQVVLLFSLLIVFLGICSSGARSSLLGFVVGMSFFVGGRAILGKSRFKEIGVILVMITLGLGAKDILLKAHYRGEDIQDRVYKTEELLTHFNEGTLNKVSSGRWYSSLMTLEMTQDKPWLGWGLDSFRFVYPLYDRRNNPDPQGNFDRWHMHPHNEWLHQASTVGLMGFGVFLYFWIHLFYRGLKKMRKEEDTKCIIILTSLSGILTLLVSWQFDTNYLFPLSRAMMALYIGILWKEIFDTAPPQKISRLTSLFFITLIGISTIMVTAHSLSLYAVIKSESSEAQDKTNSLLWANRAFLLAPGSFDALFRYTHMQARYGTKDQAQYGVNFLLSEFPYTPMALMLGADWEYAQGHWEKSHDYALQALMYDPGYEAAKRLKTYLEENIMKAPRQIPPAELMFPEKN